MANYKVIQDIEAEDKLVGPLTLRQFIYAAIAALCAYVSFWAIGKGFSLGLIILLPIMLFTAFFAFPWGRDQTTEVWALAKLRFYLKSRRRLWSQTGVKDLVTITVPKREARQQTNGLSANEVQSRLSALANTLDTRGWAVKNEYTIPPLASQGPTDRLLDISSLPQDVPAAGTTPADDILDETNNPRAQQLSEMVATATANYKQQLLDEMRQGTAPTLPPPKGETAEHWFMRPERGQSTATTPASSEAQLEAMLHEQHNKTALSNEHLKTIEPAIPHAPQAHAAAQQPQVPLVTPPAPNPATMMLANNNDLTVSTIAREARKASGSDEVVITLHRRKS